jgi:hypothetical protein
MLFSGIARPREISMMADLLDARCRAAGFRSGSPERESLAAEIMVLFNGGATTVHQLAAALDAYRPNRAFHGHRHEFARQGQQR